jgi:Spy/CpxP family protein refolding chaperone
MKQTFAVSAVILGLHIVLVTGQEPKPDAKPSATRVKSCSQTTIKAIPPLPPIPPLPRVAFSKEMFPVNLVIRHARALGLTAEQREFMQEEIQTTTRRFTELQWQLNDALEALTETLKVNEADEQAILTRLDKVLAHEREIKRLHVAMGIRIRNSLSPEQRAKLKDLRTPSTASTRPG